MLIYFQLMRKNNTEMLAVYDELEVLFNLVTSGSDVNRRTLLSLQNGSNWDRQYKSSGGSMATTNFNVTGIFKCYTFSISYNVNNYCLLVTNM